MSRRSEVPVFTLLQTFCNRETTERPHEDPRSVTPPLPVTSLCSFALWLSCVIAYSFFFSLFRWRTVKLTPRWKCLSIHKSQKPMFLLEYGAEFVSMDFYSHSFVQHSQPVTRKHISFFLHFIHYNKPVNCDGSWAEWAAMSLTLVGFYRTLAANINVTHSCLKLTLLLVFNCEHN